MKIRVFFLSFSASIILFCSTFSYAQVNPTPALQSSLQCSEPQNSMLWRVENKNGLEGSPLYLFGSLHVGKADFYPLPSIIEEYFQNSNHIVFEIDPRSTLDPEIAREIQSRGMLSLGENLEDIISAEVLENLRQVIDSLGLPVESFMRMQPWFLTLVLSNLQINTLGYSPDFGIESYLLSRKPLDADILELESIQEQIGFLESLNSETYLSYTLQNFEEEGIEEIEFMIEAWRCADIEALSVILFDDFNERDELDFELIAELNKFQQKFFYERNITMAAGITEFLENGSGNYFVVIGAGHLLGEDSVIDLLRNDGYQIDSVLLSDEAL